jgi:hypothetical protein
MGSFDIGDVPSAVSATRMAYHVEKPARVYRLGLVYALDPEYTRLTPSPQLDMRGCKMYLLVNINHPSKRSTKQLRRPA